MSEPEDPGGAALKSAVPHTIVLSNEQSAPADIEALLLLAEHALTALSIPPDAELSLLLAEPERMAELKGQYLGEAVPTDVLAFPQDGHGAAFGPGGRLLGDVVLCPAVAADQAQTAGHPVADEMHLLLVHGILHLLGHDHAEDDEKAVMQAEERRILSSFPAVNA